MKIKDIEEYLFYVMDFVKCDRQLKIVRYSAYFFAGINLEEEFRKYLPENTKETPYEEIEFEKFQDEIAQMATEVISQRKILAKKDWNEGRLPKEFSLAPWNPCNIWILRPPFPGESEKIVTNPNWCIVIWDSKANKYIPLKYGVYRDYGINPYVQPSSYRMTALPLNKKYLFRVGDVRHGKEMKSYFRTQLLENLYFCETNGCPASTCKQEDWMFDPEGIDADEAYKAYTIYFRFFKTLEDCREFLSNSHLDCFAVTQLSPDKLSLPGEVEVENLVLEVIETSGTPGKVYAEYKKI